MKRNCNPYELLVKVQNDAATVENIWLFFKHLKIELPYELATSLLGMHLKKTESRNSNRFLYTHIQNSFIHDGGKVKAT